MLGVIYAPCATEVAVSSVLTHFAAVDPLGVLARFRQGFHASLYAREDALFEPTDALLCTSGPIRTLVELCLAAPMGVGAARISSSRAGPE